MDRLWTDYGHKLNVWGCRGGWEGEGRRWRVEELYPQEYISSMNTELALHRQTTGRSIYYHRTA
jgi:hypothetical protein